MKLTPSKKQQQQQHRLLKNGHSTANNGTNGHTRSTTTPKIKCKIKLQHILILLIVTMTMMAITINLHLMDDAAISLLSTSTTSTSSIDRPSASTSSSMTGKQIIEPPPSIQRRKQKHQEARQRRQKEEEEGGGKEEKIQQQVPSTSRHEKPPTEDNVITPGRDHRHGHARHRDDMKTIDITNKQRKIIDTPHPPSSTASLDDGKEPLIEILRHSNLSTNEIESIRPTLPTWGQVLDRIGSSGGGQFYKKKNKKMNNQRVDDTNNENNNPFFVGLDTCQEYREMVPNFAERVMGVAGTFNSGTNLLHEVLKSNCHIPGALPRYFNGIMWQVNWGKHRPVHHRFENHIYPKHDNSKYLPVVIIRDPYTWMQSMCNNRYASHWFHHVDHCPNLIPNHVEKLWYRKTAIEIRNYFNNDPWKTDDLINKAGYTLRSSVVPLYVRYKDMYEHHDSLIHLWKDWYEAYYYADFPRLMIRLEDVVFRPYETLRGVCQCIGGTYIQNENELQLYAESTKEGEIHGVNKTGLAKAMTMHVFMNRTKGMTNDDIQYVQSVLDQSILMERFGYTNPISSTKSATKSARATTAKTGGTKAGTSARTAVDSTTLTTERNDDDDKEQVVNLLRAANFTTNEIQSVRKSLPTWTEVTERLHGSGMNHDQPIIIGKETCTEYQQLVPEIRHRVLGIAGMFNSGTNLLHQLLTNNCQIPDASTRYMRGIMWQVNWGKHRPIQHRMSNKVFEKHDNERYLPVVIVRDPYTWMQSMCKNRYSAHWYHHVDHCPNLVPNSVDYEWYNKSRAEVREYFNKEPYISDGIGNKINNVMFKAKFDPYNISDASGSSTTNNISNIPLVVHYSDNENWRHESLIHFWKEWHLDYYQVGIQQTAGTTTEDNGKTNDDTTTNDNTNQRLPRLMVRLEDVVFRPYETMKEICSCVGGIYIRSSNEMTLVSASAKGSYDTKDQNEKNKNKNDNDSITKRQMQNEKDGKKAKTKNNGHTDMGIAHGTNRTDFFNAMMMHIYSNRTKHMTYDDMQYVKRVLDEPIITTTTKTTARATTSTPTTTTTTTLMDLFGYKHPVLSTTTKSAKTRTRTDSKTTSGKYDNNNKRHVEGTEEEIDYDDDTDADGKGRLMALLRAANFTRSERELFRETLPTWDEVTERLGGTGPKIIGKETCEEYRNAITDPRHRVLGVAGMFNSGTNMLHESLELNCKVPKTSSYYAYGLMWQVNWGKHRPESHRIFNKVVKNHNSDRYMPIVIIRDPYTWMQSMCKYGYSAHWFHHTDHCPNLVPNHVEYEWFKKKPVEVRRYFDLQQQQTQSSSNTDGGTMPDRANDVIAKAGYALNSTSVPVNVRYNKENITKHESLLHLWMDWYDEYYQSSKPRLMIRLEDLVFFPYETLSEVCECIGGTFVPKLAASITTAKGDDDDGSGSNTWNKKGISFLSLPAESSKVGTIHGTNKTGLVKAMYMHVYQNRTKGMSYNDIIYSKQHLNLQQSNLFHMFGYQHP